MSNVFFEMKYDNNALEIKSNHCGYVCVSKLLLFARNMLMEI